MIELATANWINLLITMVAGFLIMSGVTAGVQRYLKPDKSEREHVLQGQINAMENKLKDYEDEIATLRGHVKLLVRQYDDLVIQHNSLKQQDQNNQKEMNALKIQVDQLSQASINRDTRRKKILYVVIGSSDAGMSLDLASIRAVETDTGLEVEQIQDPTPDILERSLKQAKREKYQIYLHLAVKADKDGYMIGENIVDATWLSSILDGVLVLVVAGTDSNYIGEFLGIVPHVVSMKGGVSNREAAIFSRAFWTEIGRGINPPLALKRALVRAPEGLRDQIVASWESHV